jgi:hypothetical protein
VTRESAVRRPLIGVTLAGMDVPSIIAEPTAFIGREVAVDGFVMVGMDSRLVADPDRPDEPAILLPHPATKGRLLQCVPPGGGGRYIYCDPATVVGVIEDGPLRFVSVRRLVVRRDEGQVYEFDDVA